ncbi:MAG TPA: peptidoglycan DD-metalloendopeptidase family protein [Cryobacterium sp.]|nr:peptidoglycan DD-metalloendopeptidase family protein [Cryobacterium sp.]
MSRLGTAIDHGIKAGLAGLRRRRGADIRSRRAVTVTGFTTALVLAATLASPVGAAQATKYPSWEDLQKAKSNASAAAGKVAEIKGLIAGLQSEVAQKQAEADARGAELQIAQEKLDDAARRASDLQAQAEQSKAKADAATRQAGQLAAQLYRTGGTDLSVNLFLDGGSSGAGADELLSKLGSMSKLVERSTEIYDQAQAAKNAAQALGDQAKVAKAERETLRIAAQDALVAAQDAADAAAAALAESETKGIELAAQLKFMQDTVATTAAAYQAGVVERARLKRLAEARAKAAREKAAREEAARAAAAASGGGGSSPASGGGGGSGDSQGWVVPGNGRITGGYGPRPVICGSDGCSNGFHYGTDIGTGCYAPIYAAHSGTVVYAGRLGTYGNFVLIDNGGGVETGYAHIRDGGIFVGRGQSVGAGENIASSGSTGASTACHLHFEVRINGARINAVPFMAARGAGLGW